MVQGTTIPTANAHHEHSKMICDMFICHFIARTGLDAVLMIGSVRKPSIGLSRLTVVVDIALGDWVLSRVLGLVLSKDVVFQIRA